MASALELSVVIPAFREEENLRLLLPRLRSVLTEGKIAAEILVVDTMEPLDHTALACALHDACYVSRLGGNSYGDAVRTGIREAAAPFIIFMDADGSHSPEFLPKLWAHRDAVDVVIASRYVAGGNTENNFLMIMMSRVVNVVFSLVLNLRCRDVSNSFKLYRAADLKALQLRCSHFDVVEEILVKLAHGRDLQIKEVPFTFKKRLFGKSKRNLVLFVLTYVFTLLKLRLYTFIDRK